MKKTKATTRTASNRDFCGTLMYLSHCEGTDKFGNGKRIYRQDSRILAAFQTPHTMLEVSRLTSIERASICWAVARAVKNHRLYYCGTRNCKVSGCKAGTYCTEQHKAKEIKL